MVLLAFAGGRLSKHTSPGSGQNRRVLYYVDPMHPEYRSANPGTAPDCGMALEPVYEGQESTTHATAGEGAVSISRDRLALIGVKTEVVRANSGTRAFRTTGRVVPDENRVYRMIAASDGWVESLSESAAGTSVKKNQRLGSFYSPELRAAETAYLGFLGSIERLKSSLDPAQQKSVNESLRVSEEQLRSFGMSEAQLEELRRTRVTSSQLALTSPADGVVLSRGITPRQRFDKGAELYRIADLSHVWILADVYGVDTQHVRPGQRVKVNVPGSSRAMNAMVSANTALVDVASRALKLRLEAPNPMLVLRPDMFVDLQIEIPASQGISVPADAVLDSGVRKLVYVETTDGVFEARPIEIGEVNGGRATITHGLREGERVVTEGNFLIDSESRLRADNSGVSPASAERKSAVTNVAEDSVDPVCGMTIPTSDAGSAHVEHYEGKTYRFCSDSCRKKFHEDPSKYVSHQLRSAVKTASEAASR